MSPTGVKVSRIASGASAREAERHELSDIVIGKDVLELVSSAMYIDPMAIYREYIQNAADAVDAARANGTLRPTESGRVDIQIDPATRTIRIRDNGCGIRFRDFGRKLTALGSSAKRGTDARGFRGVGRLAGLGYAQELIFRSRVLGESKVSQLRWDCRRLKTILRDVSENMSIADLIRNLTVLERVEIKDVPEQFFEVEMKGVVRLRNDPLMSPSAISEYLSQVAPVPFSPTFAYGPEITKALDRHVDLGALHIRIGGAGEPIYRPHRDGYSFDGKQNIVFDSLRVVEIPGIDGNVAAVGWVLHHDYEGAIPKETMIKGLRLRSGNIQVGDYTLLEELFPEPRFNVWSVGEVHVIDRRIVPNGRRDHFEQNAHFNNLVNHLTPVARDIARRCRTSSIKRKWLREFELHRDTVTYKLDVAAQGSVGALERRNLLDSSMPIIAQMEKIANMQILADEHGPSMMVQAAEVRKRHEQLADESGLDTSPLSHLPKKKRAMYEHLFQLVYECSSNRVAAKALVDRILDRLRTSANSVG